MGDTREDTLSKTLRHSRCRYCQRSGEFLMLHGLLQLGGARSSVDIVNCPARLDGGEHDFTVAQDALFQ